MIFTKKFIFKHFQNTEFLPRNRIFYKFLFFEYKFMNLYTNSKQIMSIKCIMKIQSIS